MGLLLLAASFASGRLRALLVGPVEVRLLRDVLATTSNVFEDLFGGFLRSDTGR